MRAYAVKVELVTAGGDHLRFIPSAVAQAMIKAGHAEIAHANGKIRSVKLITTASTCAQMIAPPSTGWQTPRFAVREKLECGATVWRHHPRSTY